MMVKIGKTFSRNVMAVLTNMDQPLGNNIGNSLEISEAIDILKNKKNSNLSTLCIFLASNMVSLALKISYKKAQKLVMTKWHNGEAYKKFLQLIEYQGGNIAHLGKAQHVLKIKAPKSGYITHIDTYKLGLLLVDLGGGRITKDDIIDYEVGFILAKGLNDYINDGDVLLKVHYNDKNVSKKDILDCFIISPRQIKMPKLIFKIIK